jgi:hypothetical protein
VTKPSLLTPHDLAESMLLGGHGNAIANNQIAARSEHYPEVVVVDGGLDTRYHRWRTSDFTTDPEGDGPSMSCIRW